mmetsp:Transcript_85982/g.243927  ORF Transcript_85982/g.243927 Transcript_85982/m.243927 type:complete len:187 (-) Transcript_85982:160-720(-)|eukprot:CAMPEP_0179245076 /NCGR_PEP_ID=MMETSP0797-20121207/18386_1 /TAXON_ID=47934 /ORGANISM="Dinophysis acuminata, Strain DAEP01" /LENGTH=186 /DNA_ID=CAMNT_0020952611 /DNA_START=97 /DNA_END=657 /DNA_ORIENTATION=-
MAATFKNQYLSGSATGGFEDVTSAYDDLCGGACGGNFFCGAPSPCGAFRAVPAQKVAQPIDWNYVGDGNGDFKEVQMYDYVGNGAGSFEKEEIVTYRGWRPRKCCVAVVLIVALASIALIAGIFVVLDERDTAFCCFVEEHARSNSTCHTCERTVRAAPGSFCAESRAHCLDCSKGLWCESADSGE